MISRLLICLLLLGGAAFAQNNAYKSPYTVNFSFKEQDLIPDLLKGPRSNPKDYASVPFGDWYNPSNEKRWSYYGPAAKHFSAPTGLASKSPQWSRERVIAAGMRFIGYTYQHHHVPDWDPPAEWPRSSEQKTPVGKGLDCSNFTAFSYNLALGIKPGGEVKGQSEMTEANGPGPNRTIPVKRIELPKSYEDFARTLQTGDLLYIKNTKGTLSHVVLWVGKIGKSPDGTPLILDSTGSGAHDSNGTEIPNGIQLRPFKRNTWYFTQASHVLRIIPGDS
ncbi:NlpC/P60 family protein [Prosthecobacter sp.]|uniref:NlpC/P60 family protein n=1 Tax=Prosthecobacter sp. TaxID=1965333 RepID=UPI003784A872